MKDISEKFVSLRRAVAEATLVTQPETIVALRRGQLPKGDPLPVARVAAIQAAKNASQIIPYCHPLPLEHAGIDFEIGDDRITVTASVSAHYKTGVEMEALAAATVAALTLYDMMKGIDPLMTMTNVRVLEKTGGKSDIHVHSSVRKVL